MVVVEDVLGVDDDVVLVDEVVVVIIAELTVELVTPVATKPCPPNSPENCKFVFIGTGIELALLVEGVAVGLPNKLAVAGIDEESLN